MSNFEIKEIPNSIDDMLDMIQDRIWEFFVNFSKITDLFSNMNEKETNKCIWILDQFCKIDK
jgi:hypothetical protein